MQPLQPPVAGGGEGAGDGEGLGWGLGLGDGLGLGLGEGWGLGLGEGLGFGLGEGEGAAPPQPGAHVVAAGQLQILAAASKMSPAGQGATVAAPLEHLRKVAHLASKGLA